MDVRASPIAGRGLFAEVDFAKGDKLTLYDGDVHTSPCTLGDVRPQTHITEQDGLWVAGLVDPQPGRGMGSFANHSLQHNAVTTTVGNQIVLIADKPITRGEEVTLNYGSEGSDLYRMAMGELRLEVTPTGNGEFKYTHLNLLTDGQVVRVKAPDSLNALELVAGGHDMAVVNVSGASQGCFYRALAVAIQSHPQIAIEPRTVAFLAGVDVEALRRREADHPGLKLMRDRMAAFTMSLVDHMDKIYMTEPDLQSLGDQPRALSPPCLAQIVMATPLVRRQVYICIRWHATATFRMFRTTRRRQQKLCA